MKKFTAIIIIVLLIVPKVTEQGPIALAIGYAGCASVVCACYAAAGAVFGTVAAVAAPAAIVACNLAFGKCMAAASVVAAMTPF